MKTAPDRHTITINPQSIIRVISNVTRLVGQSGSLSGRVYRAAQSADAISATLCNEKRIIIKYLSSQAHPNNLQHNSPLHTHHKHVSHRGTIGNPISRSAGKVGQCV